MTLSLILLSCGSGDCGRLEITFLEPEDGAVLEEGKAYIYQNEVATFTGAAHYLEANGAVTVFDVVLEDLDVGVDLPPGDYEWWLDGRFETKDCDGDAWSSPRDLTIVAAH